MITRRTVLGAGMVVASVTYAAGFGAYAQTMLNPDAPPLDALLIDSSIQMPSGMTPFINASRQRLPIVAIELDAGGHNELMRVLNKSQAIIGISSGATLFCVERLAWDHGYRLTKRSQQCVSELGSNACQQNVAAFLSGAHTPALSPLPLSRAYRPTRADGTLHAWTMQKSASARLRQTRQAD